MIATRTVTIEIPVPQITLESALWGLVAAAIAADLVTTQVGLAAGLSESNPVARDTLTHGTAGFLALKAGAVGVGLLGRALVPVHDRWIPPACLATVWLLAALWNAHLLSEVLA